MNQQIAEVSDPWAKRQAIARALLAAPGWARVGLTSPKPALREDAAIELARAIEGAGSDVAAQDHGQLPLLL